MLIKLLFYSVLAVNIWEISCRCTFERFNFEYPPVFTQKYKSGEIVLKPIDRQLHISEGGFITAYCDSNFSTPVFGRSESEGVSSLNIKCSKGNLYYEDTEGDEKMQEVREELACYGTQPQLYSSYSEDNCKPYGTPLAYGLTVDGKQVILASFCYNFDVEEIVHIRYKSFDRSFVLQDVRNMGEFLGADNKVSINIVGSNENRTDDLNSMLRRHIKNLPDTNLFRYDNLVPVDSLVKSFSYQPDPLEGVNSIPWLVNLKDGNWKLFEELLEKEMLMHDFEVYTGIAHIYGIEEMRKLQQERIAQELELKRQRELEERRRLAEERRRVEEEERERRARIIPPSEVGSAYSPIPPRTNNRYNYTYSYYPSPSNSFRRTRSAQIDNFFEHEIRYTSGSVVKSIPLYVWAYVKSPEGDSNSTVVIGINSPFIEVKKFNELDFCRDVCPPWLEGLSATAQISSLGYMFCCRPDHAREYIQAIPRAQSIP